MRVQLGTGGRRRGLVAGVAIALVALAGACGGGGESEDAEPATRQDPATTVAQAPPQTDRLEPLPTPDD
ncbi:MAG: hypothetical protein RLN63_04375, partial [Miltoncostaeaceae bacterium]